MGGAIGVLIVESDDLTSDILRQGLPDERFSVHRTTDGAGVASAAGDLGCQVVLIGPSHVTGAMEPEIRKLLALGCRVLIVSEKALDDVGSRLLLAGASGFLLVADVSLAGLSEAVLGVASGRAALHPDVVLEVLEQWRTRSVPSRDEPVQTVTLSNRERDVLTGLADGLTNRMLAARLSVAEKTVEAHKSRLFAKLGARNQVHAVNLAVEKGLL